MSYEAFNPYRPSANAKHIIWTARDIIEEYQQQNLVLTLRQLYYQFVARGIIENSDKSYKRLGSTIAKARMGGLLDWDAIEDRARQPVLWSQYNKASDAVYRALQAFRLPRLKGQRTYVELWVEKDALAGVLRPIAAEYHVTLMVNRGYSSVSAMKEAADRIRRCVDRYGSYNAAILYLGDLDPSGEDMVRDIRERLTVFLNEGLIVNWYQKSEGGERHPVVEKQEEASKRKPVIPLGVEKLALTMPQVKKHDPPPNPAKLSDTRAKAFIAKYGRQSWEVDALSPPILRQIITSGFTKHLDLDLMEEIKQKEEVECSAIQDAIHNLHEYEDEDAKERDTEDD